MLTWCTLFQRTPENSSRASSPSCSDYENFPMVPTLETSYLARAGKNEFLNLVPDIEEMRPGWATCSDLILKCQYEMHLAAQTKTDNPVFCLNCGTWMFSAGRKPDWSDSLSQKQTLTERESDFYFFLTDLFSLLFFPLSALLCPRRVS